MSLLNTRMDERKHAVSIRLMGSGIHQVNTEIPEIYHHLTAALRPLVCFLYWRLPPSTLFWGADASHNANSMMQDVKLAFTPHQGDAFVILHPWQLDSGPFSRSVVKNKLASIISTFTCVSLKSKRSVVVLFYTQRRNSNNIWGDVLPSIPWWYASSSGSDIPLSVYYII